MLHCVGSGRDENGCARAHLLSMLGRFRLPNGYLKPRQSPRLLYLYRLKGSRIQSQQLQDGWSDLRCLDSCVDLLR